MSSTIVTVKMSPAQFEMHKKAIWLAAEVAVCYGHLDSEHLCARIIKFCRREFLTIPAARMFLVELRALDEDLGYGTGL